MLLRGRISKDDRLKQIIEESKWTNESMFIAHYGFLILSFPVELIKQLMAELVFLNEIPAYTIMEEEEYIVMEAIAALMKENLI